jgi:hypothetical protein
LQPGWTNRRVLSTLFRGAKKKIEDAIEDVAGDVSAAGAFKWGPRMGHFKNTTVVNTRRPTYR